MRIFNRKGSVGVVAGITILVIMGLAGLAVDLGYVFYTKDKMQSTADASAMAAVMDIDNALTAADAAITNNGINPSASEILRTVTRGDWDADTHTFTPNPEGMAVRVYLQKTIPAFFSKLFGQETYSPGAVATASLQQAGAVVSIGATLLVIDTAEASLLNGLLGSLLGTRIYLTVDGWQGIMSANIDLIKFLNLAKVRLGIGTTDALLEDGQVSLLDIIDLSLDALKTEDSTARADLELLRQQILSAQIDPLNLKVKLGDIIQLDANDGAFAKANVNLLDFVIAAAQVFNYKSALTLNATVDLGSLLQATIMAKVVEPPVIKIMSVGSTIHSAATRVFLDIDALNIDLGIARTDLHVPVYLELGSGNATLTDVTSEGVTMDASSSTSEIFLGSVSQNFFTSTETLGASDVGYAQIATVTLLNSINIGIKAKSFVNAMGQADPASLTFAPPFPETQSVNATAGNSVQALVTALSSPANLDIQFTGALSVVLNLLEPLLEAVVGAVNELVITPVLTPLLNVVSTGLGVYPGRADVTVHDFAYRAVLVE